MEDDGGCSGGVIDDGDFIYVVGIDEALEEVVGLENAWFEFGIVEMIRLAKEFELQFLLGLDNGERATAKGSIVDASYNGVMVVEFILDFSFND